jgi:hypothetical protein
MTALISILDACSSSAAQPLPRSGWWLKEYQAFERFVCLERWLRGQLSFLDFGTSGPDQVGQVGFVLLFGC